MKAQGRRGAGAQTDEGAAPLRPSAPAILHEVEEFIRHVRDEKQQSPNTVKAYTRDLATFRTSLDHTFALLARCRAA